MMTSLSKRKIIKDKKYLMWVCSLPCISCQVRDGTYKISETIQAHHVQLRRYGAMIRDDSRVVPLCFYPCHHLLHTKFGEKKFWGDLNFDPIEYADKLYKHYKEKLKNEKSTRI